MRHINRLDIPAKLESNKGKWDEAYRKKLDENPKARPDSSKYAHKDIRKQLMSMSYGKCFYCERMLKDEPKEVDHYVEVICDPNKAYEWTNLYMACTNCNDKVPHNKIPVTSALDPCTDSDETIKQNITFDNEIIQALPDSPKGLNTIQKFRLDSELLDRKRGKWLQKINQDIRNILLQMVAEKRQDMTQDEKKALLQYMQPNSRYSLMSEIFIKNNLRSFFP